MPLVSWHALAGAPATRCGGHPDGGRREPPGIPPHQAPGLHGARPRRVPRRALRSGACFALVASATLAGRRARTWAHFAHCGGLVCLCACVLVCLCACVHVSVCVFCVHTHATGIPIADTLVVMPRVPRLFTTLMRWSRSFQHFIFDGMAKVGCASGCTCMHGCACPACTIFGDPCALACRRCNWHYLCLTRIPTCTFSGEIAPRRCCRRSGSCLPHMNCSRQPWCAWDDCTTAGTGSRWWCGPCQPTLTGSCWQHPERCTYL